MFSAHQNRTILKYDEMTKEMMTCYFNGQQCCIQGRAKVHYPPPLSPLWGGGGLRRPPEQMSLLTFRQFSSLSRGQSAHQIFTPPPLTKILYTTPYEKSFMRQIIYNYTESLQITDTFHGKDSKRFSRQPIA